MNGWLGAVVRFIVSAFVLLFIAFILPGVEILTFTDALIAAVIISFFGYLIEGFLGDEVSPKNRGIVGFITAAVVIFAAQYFVAGMDVTLIGSLLAAFIIGVVDTFVPMEIR